MNLHCLVAFFTALAVAMASRLPAQELEGMRLSLQEAVRLALEQNLELSIERVNPLIGHEKINEASGTFDPIFSLSTPLARQERPVNSVLEQFAKDGLVLQKGFSPETSLTGKLFPGTRYSLSLTTPLVLSNSPLRLFDRSYQPVLAFTLAQPLLRDFGTDVNLTRFRQAEKNEKRNVLLVEAKTLKVIRDVETSYWSLFAAQQVVKVAQGSLSLAEDLVQRLARLKRVGLTTELDVIEAKSAVQARRGDLAHAWGAVLKAQAGLRVLVDPRLSMMTRLVVTDAPADLGPPTDLQAKIERAMAKRPEIAEQQLAIEGLILEEVLARNNALWRLDLAGTVGFTGLAGSGLGPSVQSLPSRLKGRDTFAEAFGDYFTRNAMNWSVGLQLKIPIWNREALAKLEEARLRRRQGELHLSWLRSQIAVEVEAAFQDVTAEHARLLAMREGSVLAREQLSAGERDLAAGRTAVRKVLEAVHNLSIAEAKEIAALVNYGSARSRLDTAQGLTERNNVEPPAREKRIDVKTEMPPSPRVDAAQSLSDRNKLYPPATETRARKTNTPQSPQRPEETFSTRAREPVWTVQISANPDERISSDLVRKLKDRGYEAYTIKADIKGQTWYRVRVGRLGTEDEAKELQDTLRKKEKYTRTFIDIQ